MPIDSRDLYQHAFESLRHASDFRLKIIGGWAAMYTAFAGIFVWSTKNASDAIWVVLLAAGLMTVFIWLAERRNRPGIERAKDSGVYIETISDPAIPEKCRFFSGLDKGVSHGKLVDAFAIGSLVLLFGGTLISVAQQIINLDFD